ncbi:MAG: thioredoxin domain-containing protein [Polyangiaceae bacterium]|nr:thioredoxin domain-containing protein [Polyangiaceae bacterium]
MDDTPQLRRPNRLATATSPYLRQHAHNPVDWCPWDPQALARAKQDDKPIFLSIGYAACHWCHVMERESFEDESIAAVLNDGFVCIKVDREERPDLDGLYMPAAVAVSGSGGWPMTVFLTPDQKPFFAGTYFPPTDRGGRLGLRTVLERVVELWRGERAGLVAQANELTELITEQHHPEPLRGLTRDLGLGRSDPFTDRQMATDQAWVERAIDRAIAGLERTFDGSYGGFGPAPKFPPLSALSLLMSRYRNVPEQKLTTMLIATLEGMWRGGLYDHLGGGFARYSTDERWLVPHFEKMLIDNASLARIYLDASVLSGRSRYRRVAMETLDFVLRDMQSPGGGFYSAIDADSEGEEGKYFVWKLDELRRILDCEELTCFSDHFGVSVSGNWEGSSILHIAKETAEVARRFGMPEARTELLLERARNKALAERSQRVAPLTDDKLITAYNGLMIGAMAHAHRITRDAKYLGAAERAARRVLGELSRPDGGLYRTAREGVAHTHAFLDDYAYFGDALVDLYEAGAGAWALDQAHRLVERMNSDFSDTATGGFFETARNSEPLLTRPAARCEDEASPPPVVVAARVMLRLARHFEQPSWAERAERALAARADRALQWPSAYMAYLALLEEKRAPALDLVLVGRPGEPRIEALWLELARFPINNAVMAHVDPDDPDPRVKGLALLEGKTLVGDKPALYVCHDSVCDLPVTEPDDVEAALGRARSV